jgi:DNA adenine methylase
MVASRPVVKWAGGKRRLLDRLLSRLPKGRFETYAEPFCGGGAMFFALAAEPERRFDRALLADKNAELVLLYEAIKSDVEALIDRLRGYQDDHLARDPEGRRAHFYAVRALDTAKMTSVERGARLLFLNKTCFNGLWRVNAAGHFNVPFGRYAKPRILDVKVLRAAHEALALATVRCADFAAVTRKLGKDDFVYFDPPYVPVSKTSSFTSYASDGFGPEEQERLASELARLKARGVRAMLSNAGTAEGVALYEKHAFHVEKIRAARMINSDATKRGDVDELIVTTYEVAKADEAPKTPKRGAPAPTTPARRRAAV